MGNAMGGQQLPQLSVIIPTYNRERTLSRALASVLNQKLTDFEIIIIDDGSDFSLHCREAIPIITLFEY